MDEKQLFDTFGAFGSIIGNPSISRDPESDVSKGFGFINFESFEASDKAIECMNNQYLANRQIQVTYAFKKDTPGERHGSEAERLLADKRKKKSKLSYKFLRKCLTFQIMESKSYKFLAQRGRRMCTRAV